MCLGHTDRAWSRVKVILDCRSTVDESFAIVNSKTEIQNLIMGHVLSAADERGLKALSLDSRLRRAFFDLPASTIWELAEAVPTQARKHGLTYFRDGKEETINLLLRPHSYFG